MTGLDAAVLERKIWRRIATANMIGAGPLYFYYVLGSSQFHRRIDHLWVYALLPIPIYVPAYLWSRYRAKRSFDPIASWFGEGREPTAAERHLTVTHPQRLAVVSAYCWVWALLCSLVVAVTMYVSFGFAFIGVTISMLLSAIIGCALCYLVAEDALRPLFAAALAKEGPKPRSVGIMPRLAMSWLIGSATYFLAIVLLAITLRPASATPFILGACGFAIAVGATVTVIGARSVARPLDDVRSALARVELGDLDAAVKVDDAGEVGQLQAGFNRMVTGLRERDRLKLLFDRHVGPDVARRALSANELGGVQLEASVLFVDVIGSTTLAAERPPDSVVAMLNALFSAVIRMVGAEGGLVNQFQGDGALCIFGAPDEVEDHAARALRAAVALRREITALGGIYPGFDAAIGVSTGLVVAGDVGTEDRYEYTVIGDAANEASRLTDEAKRRPSRVLASEETIRLAGVTPDRWIEVGELSLRGRPRTTNIYEPA